MGVALGALRSKPPSTSPISTPAEALICDALAHRIGPSATADDIKPHLGRDIRGSFTIASEAKEGREHSLHADRNRGTLPFHTAVRRCAERDDAGRNRNFPLASERALSRVSPAKRRAAYFACAATIEPTGTRCGRGRPAPKRTRKRKAPFERRSRLRSLPASDPALRRAAQKPAEPRRSPPSRVEGKSGNLGNVRLPASILGPFRAQGFAIAFTYLIRKWRVWCGEGFCIENPLTPTGWSRREADIADRGRVRLSWADSANTRVASGRTGVRAKDVIAL
jgi:hypothetical protein